MGIKSLMAACVIAVIYSSTANAALLSRLDGQAVYDTELDITWLTDANLAASNNFGVSGIAAAGTMNWDTANQWIAAMNVDNGTGYLGFNDWRMPLTGPVNGISYNVTAATTYDGVSDNGYNVGAPGSVYAGSTASEMAHLFFTSLGNEADFDLEGNTNIGLPPIFNGPFSNLVTHPYWSGSQRDNPNDAWEFDFAGGIQDEHFIGNPYYVLAVRSGDISPVPLPAAFWLFAAGLLSLVRVARSGLAK